MRIFLRRTLVFAATICFSAAALGNEMCFERNYDSTHLNKHPDQLVTNMTLALDPEGPIRRGADRGTFKIVFDFKLLMRKRGSDTVYVQEGYVQKSTDRQLVGVVECDGGGFRLDKVPSGILLALGDLGIRMAVVPDPCGESDRANNSTYIERGKDDGTFRLDAVSSRACSRAFDQIDWDAVAKHNE
jgi:hypothetical protein